MSPQEFMKQAVRRIRFNLRSYMRRNGGRFLGTFGPLESQSDIGQFHKARAAIGRKVSRPVPGAVTIFSLEVEARRNPKVLCSAVLLGFFTLCRHTRMIVDAPSTTLGWLLALRKTTQIGAPLFLDFCTRKGRTPRDNVPGSRRVAHAFARCLRSVGMKSLSGLRFWNLR